MFGVGVNAGFMACIMMGKHTLTQQGNGLRSEEDMEGLIVAVVVADEKEDTERLQT